MPPLAVGRITSPFGMRDHHPIRSDSGPVHHDGYDLAAPSGSPFYAARSGRVVSAGGRGGYGLTVELDHGGGLSTRYAHASRLTVREGQAVQGGEVLGFVGSTGLSTGPHLHYEVRMGGKAIDPRDAGFALAAEIRTGKHANSRLAAFETVTAVPPGPPQVKSRRKGKIQAKRSYKVKTAARVTAPVTTKTGAKVKTTAKAKTGAKVKTTAKAKAAAKVKTPAKAKAAAKVKTSVEARAAAKVKSPKGRDPRIAEIKLKPKAAIHTN